MGSGGEQLKGRRWRPPKTGLESRLESKLCARGLAGEVCELSNSLALRRALATLATLYSNGRAAPFLK
jgi:hypothetical protein